MVNAQVVEQETDFEALTVLRLPAFGR